jgi:hypothetical protein
MENQVPKNIYAAINSWDINLASNHGDGKTVNSKKSPGSSSKQPIIILPQPLSFGNGGIWGRISLL